MPRRAALWSVLRCRASEPIRINVQLANVCVRDLEGRNPKTVGHNLSGASLVACETDEDGGSRSFEEICFSW